MTTKISKAEYKELLKAFEKLERLSRRNKRFAKGVQHDLRGPLRTISGNASLLLEEATTQDDPLLLEKAEAMFSESLWLSRILESWSQYIAAEESTPEIKTVDSAEVVRKIILSKRHELLALGGFFEFSPLDFPRISTDETMLGRIIQNLVENAMKFRQAGRDLEIEIAFFQTEGQHFLSVSDNGIGIRSDNLERIFEPFETLHGPEEYDGTGLGLSIVRELTEILGGSVQVSSVFGSGTTFTIRL